MPPFAEVFLPFIFLNLKITNMKHLTLRLLGTPVVMGL